MDFYKRMKAYKALNGLNWKEIGEVVGMKESTIRVAFRRESLSELEKTALEKKYDLVNQYDGPILNGSDKISKEKGMFLEWEGTKVPEDVVAKWVAENENYLKENNVIIRNMIDLGVARKLYLLTRKGGERDLKKFLGF